MPISIWRFDRSGYIEGVKRRTFPESPQFLTHRPSGRECEMEAAEAQEFTERLEGLQERLERGARGREEIAVQVLPDAIDQVQHAAERELAVRQLEGNARLLRNIRRALLRVSSGTYGYCISCDSEIDVKRLRAVPWAQYCLKCQAVAEKQRVHSGENVASDLAAPEEAA